MGETVCVPKPVTTCNTVTRAVPDTKCVAKPVTQCRSVPFPVTVAVPREQCQPVAREVARQECALYKEAAHYGYGHAAKLISVAEPVAVVAEPAIAVAGVRADPQTHGYGPTNYAYGDGNSFVSVSRAN